MNKLKVVNISDVAKKAGCSKATVSYALRGKPGVSAVEARRILKIADRMGYRPNPLLGVHMAHIRRRAVRPYQATLGFITFTKAGLRETYVSAARERADELGYLLEEFHLAKLGVSADRLTAILLNRSIPGLIVGENPEQITELNLGWQHFAAAALGYTVSSPNLHRVCHAHYRGMTRSLQYLTKKGLNRIAYVSRPGDLIRGERLQLGAFLEFHESRNCKAGPHFEIRGLDVAPFLDWLKKARPDAIVCAENQVQKWLAEHSPETAYCSLCLDPDVRDVVGIRQGHRQIASSAVDLVVAQLQRNDRGIPAWPNIVLIEGSWDETALAEREPLCIASSSAPVS
jgi:LacI family transcriptional regulator